MANYKELRIMTHEQEFLVNTGQNTYALGNIDLTNVVFFTKSKKATYESAYEPFKVVDWGNYIISNQGTPSCSITFSTGFLDDKERIQVCREFLITSSQYITDEPNSIIVKDKLNQLISELTTLTEIIRKNQPKSDSKDVNHVFPDLLPNETFMMRDDGTLGAVTIDDVNSFIAEARTLINEHTTLKEAELDTHTDTKKTELNSHTDLKIIELNSHTIELQKIEINDLTETKKIEIIEVADDKIAEINNIIIENGDLPIATAVTKGIASFGTGFTVVNGHVTADGTNIVSANDGIIANADNIQLDTQNVLTSTSTTKPLSANMGKVLQDTKLNLTGGTLTGALNGTTATFSGDITAPNLAVFSTLDNTSVTSGTTYTNTTGKPMMITAREVNNGAEASRSIVITINGNDVSAADNYGISDLCVTAICPANGTYKVLFSGTSISRATIRQY